MSVSISFDPHRGKPIVEALRISEISNLRTGNCFDALVKTDVDLRVCAASVQVAGPHAMLQIALSANVTSELMLSSWRCEPRSSHRTFLPVPQPRTRQPSATRAQRATARAVSFFGPSRRFLHLAHVGSRPKPKSAYLFDHLVGAHQQPGRKFDPERLRRFEVEGKLNSYGLLDRQIGW